MREIFNGASLYTATEISNSCKVFDTIKAEFDKAIADANALAKAETQKLSALQIFHKYIQCMLAMRPLRVSQYGEVYSFFENKYGKKLFYSCGCLRQPFDIVRQLRVFAKANRDCYLNPDQVDMVEKTRQYWA